MHILGISAFYHDSAAAILKDGIVLAAAQEERFTRKKHDPGFPVNAVRFCLDHAGIDLSELDAVVFYDKPLLKFERLLETYYAFAPKGLRSFITAMPSWIKEKLFLRKLVTDELAKVGGFDPRKTKLLFPEHHLSHAASAFYPSPFEEAAILTIDGVGEWTTASICHGKGNHVSILKELRFPNSVGLLYSAFTYFLGFKVNSGEYKLMGLAPYGAPNSATVERFIKLIRENIVQVREDGSIWLDQDYFDYATGLTMLNDSKWEKLFGLPRRLPEQEISQDHCDLALAIQQVTEEIVLKMADEAKKVTGSKNLCLAGGVALNCVANGKLLKTGKFENIWIQPAAGDAGGALGAAYAAFHIYFNQPRSVRPPDQLTGAYLGPEYSHVEIERAARKYSAPFTRFEKIEDLSAKVAEILADGNVVGWHQGRSEWGPRALGNRSILGDPRNPEMQKRLNLKIKYRESFRPFAPSVLAEKAADYFDLNADSPYMLLVADVAKKRRIQVPNNYHQMPLKDKLYFLRSDLPAITHLDYSARVQTVHRETNDRYWQLLKAFETKTGYGVLVNTSFNVRGEPIVLTPEDSYRCFMRTEMDYLVVGDYLFSKAEQPEWKEQDSWKESLVMD